MRIAIGGVSNAGKSNLASEIEKIMAGKKITILCQDDFVFPRLELPLINDHIDWETPDSIDIVKFKKVILSESTKCDLLITEGLMIFHQPEINDLFHKRIFIDLPKEEFLNRKRKDLRWGQEPEWYIDHIWKSYLRYGQKALNEEVLILDGSKKFPIKTILSFINK